MLKLIPYGMVLSLAEGGRDVLPFVLTPVSQRYGIGKKPVHGTR